MSSISRAAMFDWALLVPTPLFPFGNRLPGNVVIIVAEASICSICLCVCGGGKGGRTIVSNSFYQVLMEDRGVKGAESSAQASLMYAEAWRSLLVASDTTKHSCSLGWLERRFSARVITRL